MRIREELGYVLVSSRRKSLQRSRTWSHVSSIVWLCSTVSLLMKRRLKSFTCSGLFPVVFSNVSLVSLVQISAHFSLILGSTMIWNLSFSNVSKTKSVVVLRNPISLQKIKSIFSFLSACASLSESNTPLSESLSLQCPKVEQCVLTCSPLQVMMSSMGI